MQTDPGEAGFLAGPITADLRQSTVTLALPSAQIATEGMHPMMRSLPVRGVRGFVESEGTSLRSPRRSGLENEPTHGRSNDGRDRGSGRATRGTCPILPFSQIVGDL